MLKKTVSALALATLAHAGLSAEAAEANCVNAGKLSDGQQTKKVTLSNSHGVSVNILSFGATLQSFMAPDRDGNIADITIGFDDVQTYQSKPNYFGVTVGRYANRIAGGKFTLDETTYQLPLNNGVNSLHGGGNGFDLQNWKVGSLKHNDDEASVVLTMTSPDGDSGYPGNLDVKITYTLNESNELTIQFEADTDKPTIVNMTNHAIFNLAGEGAPEGTTNHTLTIPAHNYTPVDATLIPTGELRPVKNTVFDFTKPRRVADGLRDGTEEQIALGRGYDHNFALDKGVTATPELAARLEDPASGRVLEVMTTEPGIQFYTGNFLDGTIEGKSSHIYRMGDGIALEPQKFPDSPNHKNFVSARIDPETPYKHVMIYKVSTEK